VNALAWITHRADHHPDLISENDFACAAKADALLQL
jgi:pterin-4a-carbinolamine dehydratase